MFVSETNECDDVNKNFCEQTCIDMRGGIKCACKQGYQLNQDAKTCSGKKTHTSSNSFL